MTFEDVTETIPIAPSEQSTEAEPTETDNLPSDSLFYDVPSDQDQEIQLPDLYPETKPITNNSASKTIYDSNHPDSNQSANSRRTSEYL